VRSITTTADAVSTSKTRTVTCLKSLPARTAAANEIHETPSEGGPCSVGGADLGDWLVRNGFALDWLQYYKGKYGDAQRGAMRAGRGIWAGSYVESTIDFPRVVIAAFSAPSS